MPSDPSAVIRRFIDRMGQSTERDIHTLQEYPVALKAKASAHVSG